MKYSPQIILIGSDPLTDLKQKEKLVKEILEKALDELETILFFIEDILRELVEKVV